MAKYALRIKYKKPPTGLLRLMGRTRFTNLADATEQAKELTKWDAVIEVTVCEDHKIPIPKAKFWMENGKLKTVLL